MGVIYAQNAIMEDGEFYRDVLTRDHILEMKEDLMEQLKTLRTDIIPITYTLHFRDKMLGAMGSHDMNVYARLMNSVIKTKGVYGRPKEWKYINQN